MDSDHGVRLKSMYRHAIALAVLLTGALSARAADPPAIAPLLNDDRRERLDAGDTIVLDDVAFEEPFGTNALASGKTDLVFVVADSPPDIAWEVITDYDAQAGFMPKMRTSERVSRGDDGVDTVCFKHRILLIGSHNCFLIRNNPDARFQTGVLDPDRHDDRLEGVNYFWYMRPWDTDRTLTVYYQRMDYSSSFSAFGHRAFVGPTQVVSAVRDEAIRRAAARRPGQD